LSADTFSGNDATGEGVVTDTVADPDADPPVPVHVSTKVEVAERAAVACAPEVALAPLQLPDAVHELALVEDQLSVAEPPCATWLGVAEIETVGGGTALTATVAVRVTEPPAPLQASA
jgi:hypothetical protein